MDWTVAYQVGTLIVAVLFGSQGIMAWRRQRQIKNSGEAGETKSAADYLTGYYQQELDSLRGDQRNELAEARREIIKLRRLRESDAIYIDQLEAWIWQGKGPPPPNRQRFRPQPPKEETGQ